MFCAKALLMAAAIALTLPECAHGQARPAQKSGDHTAAATQEFSGRLATYLKVREEKSGGSARPSKSATKIAETREQMRNHLQQARAQAKQGEIFTPRVAAYFRKQIASAFRGPAGARVLASLRRAEPVKARVVVNQPYPEGIALQSTPPSLLMKLPKLPKELEYRIVGRDLVLLDTEPNLVVDVLPGALPRT